MIQEHLNAIHYDPDDEARWLALTQHLDDGCDYDPAIPFRRNPSAVNAATSVNFRADWNLLSTPPDQPGAEDESVLFTD